MKTRIENGVTILTIEKDPKEIGVHGIYYKEKQKKYRVVIKVGQSEYHLGFYANIEDAKEIRIKAEILRDEGEDAFLKWYKPWREENNYKRK